MCIGSGLHPASPTACHVKKGPKAFHFDCGICGSRVILAPKILKPSSPDAERLLAGMTITVQQAIHGGLTPLP